MSNLFRKSALERLASPEQLDKTIVITSPLSWLSIIGVAIIIVSFIAWSFVGTLPTTVSSHGVIVGSENVIDIHSKYSGEIVQYYIKEGNNVKIGDKIADIKVSENIIETLLSTQNGTVSQMLYKENDYINKYDNIIRLSPQEENVVLCYIPVETGKSIKEGQEVIISPMAVDEQRYGHMEAVVLSVDDYITSSEDIKKHLGNNEELSNIFLSDTVLTSVVCTIKKDNNTASGYYWSSFNGGDIKITDGTICNVKIITDESAPISKLFPSYKKNTED